MSDGILQTIVEWKEYSLRIKKVLDKKEFKKGELYKSLVDDIEAAEYAIDKINQAERQETCIIEIMMYIHLSGNTTMSKAMDDIINRYKAI